MAIKTKKITELGQIHVDVDALSTADFYLLGCQSGVTGKVPTNALVDAIKSIASSSTGNSGRMIDAPAMASLEVTDGLQSSINVIVERISKSDSAIEALEAKVEALEGFVKSLQADGYLTLANIKKAAAEACPICTHTHEETAE